MRSTIRCSSAAIRWMLTIMTIGSLSWFIISIRGEYFSIVLAQTDGARQQADASLLVGAWNLAYATNEEGG